MHESPVPHPVDDADPHDAHPELPLAPDIDVDDAPDGAAGPIPPQHIRPSFLVLVFAGGTLGTASREALSLAFPPVDGLPHAIFAINLLGAFLLGLLLEGLTRRGANHGRNRHARLLLGTGFLGGFTTYSALATDTALLLGDGRTGVGLGYALATLLLGAAATWGGIAAAALGRPSAGGSRIPDPGTLKRLDPDSGSEIRDPQGSGRGGNVHGGAR